MEPEKSRGSGSLRELGGVDESGYRFLNDTNMLAALGARRAQRQRRQWVAKALAPWYRLSAPPEPPASVIFTERDRQRRARLASVLILGFAVVTLAQLPFGLRNTATFVVAGVALLAGVGMVWLNRIGQVNAVGALMLLVSYIVLGYRAAPDGRLSAGSPLTLDLLVVTELIAVTILPPVSVLLVAAINCAAILLAITLLPHDASFRALFAGAAGGSLIARALALQILVAVVAYLWARSALRALRRADRAEEIAILERREVERTREIEEGVRQLQATLVQLANGDFSARVPPVRNALLWQVGVSVNNLIGRVERLTQGAPDTGRLRAEARQLADTIFAWSRGAQPIWPAPTGSPLDEVTLTLRRTLGPAPAPTGAPVMPPAAYSPASHAPSGPPGPASYAPASIPAPASRPTPGPSGYAPADARSPRPAPTAPTAPPLLNLPAPSSPAPATSATPSVAPYPLNPPDVPQPATHFTYPDLYPTQLALPPTDGIEPAAPLSGLLAPPSGGYTEPAHPPMTPYANAAPLDSYPSLDTAARTAENDQEPTQPALPDWLRNAGETEDQP